MAINQFVPFASGIGANVEDLTTYLTGLTTTTGFVSGEALSANCNRVWKQSTVGSTAIGSLIAQILQVDALDDGNMTVIESNLASAIRTSSFATDTSSVANVMLASLDIGPLSLFNGLVISIKPAITNTTSVTLNLNSLGARPVITNNGTLLGGELIAGNAFQLIFLTSLNSWLLLNYQTTCVTQAPGDNSTKLANTNFVSTSFAPLNTPALTGTGTSTTPPLGDNSTRIATTAFVHDNVPTIFPSGTRLLFAQASAPTGWVTLITDSQNNRMLRVVTSGGGSVGGTSDPLVMSVVPNHTHIVTSTVHDPGHHHTSYGPRLDYNGDAQGGDPVGVGSFYYNTTDSVTGITVTSVAANNVGASNWTPRYLDLICCEKL